MKNPTPQKPPMIVTDNCFNKNEEHAALMTVKWSTLWTMVGITNNFNYTHNTDNKLAIRNSIGINSSIISGTFTCHQQRSVGGDTSLQERSWWETKALLGKVASSGGKDQVK